MDFYRDQDFLGTVWLKNKKNEKLTFQEAASSILEKYRYKEPTFFNEITSKEIKKFDVFYDSFYLQTPSGFIFEKYISTEFEIKPFSYFSNFQSTIVPEYYVDYWFDEKKHKVYIFESLPTFPIIPDVENHGYVEFGFQFKVFDIKTNTIKKIIKENEIKFWLSGCDTLKQSNGVYEQPLLTYNIDTNIFNASFLIKNDRNDVGIISLNFNETQILNVNTFIPFGIVQPLEYTPPDVIEGLTIYPLENSFVTGSESTKFIINYKKDIGQAGLSYTSSGLPIRFDIIWNGQRYSTGYVGNSIYDGLLLNLGIPLSSINTGFPSTGVGILNFDKFLSEKELAIIEIYTPIEGDNSWSVFGIAPEIVVLPTPTPTPTPTSVFSTPTPTPTNTRTPSNTPPPLIPRAVYITFD